MKKILIASLITLFTIVSCTQNTNQNKDKKVDSASSDTTIVEKSDYKSKMETKKELATFFVHHKSNDIEQIMPKHVSSEGKGIYCYFFVKGKRAISLKLHIEYPEYDADLYELEVNGQTETFEVNKSHAGSSNMQIAGNVTFQWYDKGINLSDEEFLKKVSEAETATLSIKRKDSDKVLAQIKLTKEECISLTRTIDYYKSLDGAKIPKKGMVNIRG